MSSQLGFYVQVDSGTMNPADPGATSRGESAQHAASHNTFDCTLQVDNGGAHCSKQAVSGKGRHRACRLWFHPNTSTRPQEGAMSPLSHRAVWAGGGGRRTSTAKHVARDNSLD